MRHTHVWSNDTIANHCEGCMLPFWRYVAWLESIVRSVAALNAVTAPPELAALIDEARVYPVGSDLAERARM